MNDQARTKHSPYRFTVLTLFPEQIQQHLQASITGRALLSKKFELETVQLRDYAINSYGKVDDKLAGGGTGMLLRCEPIHEAVLACSSQQEERRIRRIYLSPKGRVLNQTLVQELAQEEGLLLLCGHYEGVDARVIEEDGFEEISLGDFVLTGGELAACVLIDAVARLLPGVLPREEAYANESHYGGRLEEPQYTKPAIWAGCPIPPVLLGGDHNKQRAWKDDAALLETLLKRPDLLDQGELDRQEWLRLVTAYREKLVAKKNGNNFL